MPRQFIACAFREGQRPYTYHHDGPEEVAVGDVVRVPSRKDGWQRATVVSISDEAPEFATKAILGKLDPETAGQGGASCTAPRAAGVHAIDPEEYHRDPAGVPSLSSSLAKLLIWKSPKHAWTASPRLNPDYEPKRSDAFDIGSTAHALILGKGGRIRVVVADSWQTKHAKEAREAAREASQTPVLAHQFDAAQRMAQAVTQRLADMGVVLAPRRSEMAAMAEIDGVWCRALVDNAPEDPSAPLIDIKTCMDASPDACTRAVTSYDYAVQACWYREVWKAATGEERRFQFVFVEKEPPHEIMVAQLYEGAGSDADWFEDASQMCVEARRIWRLCLETGEWPGYPPRVALLGAPGWYRNRWANAQTIAPEPKPSREALRAAYEMQAPFRGAAE